MLPELHLKQRRKWEDRVEVARRKQTRREDEVDDEGRWDEGPGEG